MPASWEARWRPAGERFAGGQGKALSVERLDGSTRGFLKKLKSPRSDTARARFRREVSSYETLPDAELPRLYEHNADQWNDDQKTPLYLILELVDGPNLEAFVEDNGPLTLEQMKSFSAPLLRTLEACHRQGVLHRDIKPKNIVVRDSNYKTPVLVDFGLSFNLSEVEQDLTRVDEEIGNRFLRLPEQGSRLRSPLTDISQLSGTLFYALTGVQPRVLIDESDAMPHQRADVRDRLEGVATGRELPRLLAFFDRAFAPSLSLRYGSVRELGEGIARVTQGSADLGDNDDLLRRVDEIAGSPRNQARATQLARLQRATERATDIVRDFAKVRGLVVTQTGHELFVDQTIPAGGTSLSVHDAGSPPHLIRYEFEIRGAETLLLIDGETLWRGGDPECDPFDLAITRNAALNYLAEEG